MVDKCLAIGPVAIKMYCTDDAINMEAYKNSKCENAPDPKSSKYMAFGKCIKVVDD